MINKVAIVTGSSRGIGKGIAKELLLAGSKVILNGRNEDRLKATQSELLKISKDVHYFCCDITNSNESENLINYAIDTYGSIDILVNNVGVSSRGTVEESRPEVFERVMKSNFIGSVLPTIYAMKFLRKTSGSLVFISSVAGIRGLPTNHSITLQGNFDPHKLLLPIPELKNEVKAMIDSFGPQKYIANLGHGILPNIPVDHAKAFVDAVKCYNS